MRRVALAVLAALASVAEAGTATLNWTAPTKFTDGSSIAGAITYNVYKGLQGQNKALLVGGVTTLTYSATGLVAGTTVCFTVTAVVAGQESDPSNEGCKLIPLPVPNPPSLLTITANVFQRHNNQTILVGRVALGVTCGALSAYKSPYNSARLYALPRSRVIFTKRDWGTAPLGVCA